MKNLSGIELTGSIWALHISSLLMSAMPYLQATSLILAITVSIYTLIKLRKGNK